MTETNTPAAENIATSLTREIEAAHTAMTRSKADLLEAIRLFDCLELAHECGATTTAQFLVRRLAISSSTAYEYVHVAHRIGRFQHLARHFREGELSYSTVRLLLKYLNEENEEELVSLGLKLGYHELERALAGREPEGEGEEDPPEYYLRLHARDNGDISFHGNLNPADGAAFMAALKLGEIAYYDLDEVLEGVDPEEEDAVDEARDAVMDIEETVQARQTASGYGLPIGRILVNALMGMVHMIRTNPRNSLTTPAAHVNITATMDGRAYMPNNLGAPSMAIANILANANMRVSTVDETGLILNTGRQFRLANPAQVNALLTMWGGQCAAPGCTHTRFIEMHHILDWANGGHTDLENLLPLCSACHSLVTEGYLQTVKEDADIHFIYGDGTRFVSRNYSMAQRCDNAMTMDEYNALMDEEVAFADA